MRDRTRRDSDVMVPASRELSWGMYRQQLTAADDQLRAAHAALSERDRLTTLRAGLATELDEATRFAAELGAKLADEQKDVARYEGGVWAFLYNVVADREARLNKEQREAHEAEAKYGEAAAARDRLQSELAAIDTRLATLASADADLAAARAGKQAVLMLGEDATAKELRAIADELTRCDAEGLALDEAISAGGSAHTRLALLMEVLASARNWGTADIFANSMLLSWMKREKIDQARGIAGEAQGALAIFRRELGDVGLTLTAQLAELADHHRFLDVWFDNIFSDVSVQSRIREAMATTGVALEEVARRLEDLYARRQQMIDRSSQLSTARIRLLEHAG